MLVIWTNTVYMKLAPNLTLRYLAANAKTEIVNYIIFIIIKIDSSFCEETNFKLVLNSKKKSFT